MMLPCNGWGLEPRFSFMAKCALSPLGRGAIFNVPPPSHVYMCSWVQCFLVNQFLDGSVGFRYPNSCVGGQFQEVLQGAQLPSEEEEGDV